MIHFQGKLFLEHRAFLMDFSSEADEKIANKGMSVFVFELTTIMVFWSSALRFMSRFVFCLLTILCTLAKYNYTTLEWGLQLVVA